MSEEARDEKFEGLATMSLKSGELELNKLNFSFSDNKIIEDISFKIGAGEILGVVGNLGSGKSTLLKSIIGYHLPEIGMVKIGSFDINNIPSDVLRNEIGYCPQNVQLFSGTIYENIASGIEVATEDDVFNAANLALSHEFIAALPGGYNYVLRENGSNLSGGQRQAISLARALIKKPKVLVLDEPTSSMDTDTEIKVMENLYNLEQKPTIIISSHKLGILTKAQKIAVILNGKLAAFGPTNEIIKKQEG